jgi:hypothetical protein
MLFSQILNVLGIIGAVLLVFSKRIPRVPRLVGLFGLSGGLFLILMRLSGTLAVFYNSERALIQVLGVFSITFCWVLESIANRWQRRVSAVLWVTALFLSAFMVNTTGLIGAALGGGTATNLANSGEDYERYYRTAQELAAATWLGSHVRSGQLVYADRYAELTLEALTTLGTSVNQDVTPLTINKNAWVYASSANVVDGRGRAAFGNDLITYTFPALFLDQNFDIVYSDGASEVFHR